MPKKRKAKKKVKPIPSKLDVNQIGVRVLTNVTPGKPNKKKEGILMVYLSRERI
jgi:hypothetical protein